MPYIGTSPVDEIKSKLDIVDVISEYIQLKRAGTNYKANCPFHTEKTPSFMVSPDRQIWHCFGCSEGGDIFSFVMKMEGMEFPEALRVLAKKAGVRLTFQDPALINQKTKLLDICKAAASFFHEKLISSHQAQFVRNYLKKREVSDDAVEDFKLGFAPDAWDELNKYLVQKKFLSEDIFLAGLTVKKERSVGFYDRFRNRLIFPINDVHGNVVGFGGRWLGEEKEGVAKYVNSPQTMIYDKSRVLYGLDRAKQEIRKQKLAVIVEGYMDLVASHQAGVVNIVASSGTALTNEQVKLLKRYTPNIAFAFDSDIAGEDASKRGIDVALANEINTKIIILPFGKDPDELIKKDVKAWQKAIAEARSIMEYYFESTLKNKDLSNVDDKKIIAKTLLGIITKIADPIEQAHYLQKLAEIIKVEESILRDKLKNLKKDKIKTYEDVPTAKIQKNRFEILGEQFVGLILEYPEHLNYIIDQFLPEYLLQKELQNLYKRIIIYYTNRNELEYPELYKNIKKDDQKLAHYCDILRMKIADSFSKDKMESEVIEKEIKNNIRELKKNYIQNELKLLQEKMNLAEKEEDQEKLKKLIDDFNKLTSQLKDLL